MVKQIINGCGVKRAPRHKKVPYACFKPYWVTNKAYPVAGLHGDGVGVHGEDAVHEHEHADHGRGQQPTGVETWREKFRAVKSILPISHFRPFP